MSEKDLTSLRRNSFCISGQWPWPTDLWNDMALLFKKSNHLKEFEGYGWNWPHVIFLFQANDLDLLTFELIGPFCSIRAIVLRVLKGSWAELFLHSRQKIDLLTCETIWLFWSLREISLPSLKLELRLLSRLFLHCSPQWPWPTDLRTNRVLRLNKSNHLIKFEGGGWKISG